MFAFFDSQRSNFKILLMGLEIIRYHLPAALAEKLSASLLFSWAGELHDFFGYFPIRIKRNYLEINYRANRSISHLIERQKLNIISWNPKDKKISLNVTNIEKPNHLVNLDNISCTPYIFLQLEKYTFLNAKPSPWNSWGLWLRQEQARQKPLIL